MTQKLLSIVVPTKNRAKYLYSLIELCSLFKSNDFELVIQDNSDDDQIARHLKNRKFDFIVYNYNPAPMPVIKNSELAILNSIGKYVCFIGDDDLLSEKIIDFVSYMDENQIESAIFHRAIFNWPGMKFVKHKFPNLIIKKFKGKLYRINVQEAFSNLLKHGATSLSSVPQLYHGVVRRDLLDKVFANAGTYFPGPSPDMAVAVALSYFVNSHVFFDVPLVSSGKSPLSAAGLGAKHEHKGNLRDMKFLPVDIEEKWDKRLPKIWTGQTIYAESALEAMKALNKDMDVRKFNFKYFFAAFDTFNPDYKDLTQSLEKEHNIKTIEYYIYRLLIFLHRSEVFIQNKLLLQFHLGGVLIDNIENTVQAQMAIEKEINKTIPCLFEKLHEE